MHVMNAKPTGTLLSELVLGETHFAVRAGQTTPTLFYIDATHVTPDVFQARLALATAIAQDARDASLDEAMQRIKDMMDQLFGSHVHPGPSAIA